MDEYKLLDTSAFDTFIENQGTFVKRYNEIIKKYETIVSTLTETWKGSGADAFKEDAMIVKSNITGIGDILQTMCDMLIDCRNAFEECDRSVGTTNREAAESN